MPNSYSLDYKNQDNFKNARLLLIEDNPDHCVIIENALRHCLPEIKLLVVTTEADALDYFEQCRLIEWELPKLILLDLYLPDRENGWRLLDYIKQMPAAFSKIPVVLLTSSSDRNDVAEGYDRGCSSYLVKPGSLDDWMAYFQTLRSYWWETVTLPKPSISMF
jgi:CheY-like chemotaxis protein